jgi:hypothetical protein
MELFFGTLADQHFADICFGWLFKMYNHPKAKGIVFNTGLAIGISSFIFFPSITFIVWVLVALMIMRPFRINEWLLCLLGLTSPYYFYGIYLFLTGSWAPEKILPYLTIHMPSLQQSIWLAASALLLMVPFSDWWIFYPGQPASHAHSNSQGMESHSSLFARRDIRSLREYE